MPSAVPNRPAIIVRRSVTRIAAAGVARSARTLTQAHAVTAREQAGRTAVVHRGRAGHDAESAPIEAVSFESIDAGQVVRLRSTSGKASPARADAIATSDVFGVSLDTVGSDLTVRVTRDRVTVADWTAIAGTEFLTPGQTYFLSPTVAGGIQTTPPTTAGHVVCVVGEALTTTTLAVQIGIPILL